MSDLACKPMQRSLPAGALQLGVCMTYITLSMIALGVMSLFDKQPHVSCGYMLKKPYSLLSKAVTWMICTNGRCCIQGKAADIKAKGNAAFSAGRFQEAIEHFTSCIQMDPE